MNQDEIGKIETRKADFTTGSLKNHLSFHVSLILMACLFMLSKASNIISTFPIPIFFPLMYNKNR